MRLRAIDSLTALFQDTAPETAPGPETDATGRQAAESGTNAAEGVAQGLERFTAWVGLGDYPWVASLLGGALVLLLAYVAYLVTMRYLLRAAEKLIRRSSIRWDDVVLEKNVLRRVAMLAPVLVIFYGIQLVPQVPGAVEVAVQRFGTAFIVLVLLLAASALISAAHEIYRGSPVAQGRPIKGYLQIVQIFLFLMGGIFIVAVLLDRSPWAFVTGIGAMTAVLLLIFRDTILSFVASIQLVSNDMVRIGDWIEMPKYGADGDVIDIALHTVKVQNWDKTVSTIPTYKLIEDSFKNWRGMTESGGRRIKRSLYLDVGSVRFLTPEEVDRFGRFALLKDYIAAKRKELEGHNAGLPREEGLVVNARRLTNLGTFRAYISAYVAQHPGIHREGMTFLVRQLPPGPEGVGLEIYVFANDTAWVRYEAIQGDIFDHLLAITPEFGLRIYQKPAGHDLAHLAHLAGAAGPGSRQAAGSGADAGGEQGATP